MYYYGFDSYYLFLVLPAIILAMIASTRVKTTFNKFSKIPCRLTGEEAARRVLELNGVYGVRIERVSGSLTDHFDPRTNVIRLSDTVFSSNSIAAVGVAAHEAGHAVQYQKNYLPIKLRGTILPICNLGSKLAFPLILMGLLFNYVALAQIGIIFFAFTLLFQLITLPVEFNASGRALKAIRENNLLTSESDYNGAKKVLWAAAMTYITAFLVSLTQLIRLLAITNRRRR